MQYYQQHAEFKYLNSDRQNFNIELPFHSNCFPFKCLFLLKNIDCGYSLEPPRRGGSNEYPLPGIIVLQVLSLRLSIFQFRQASINSL